MGDLDAGPLGAGAPDVHVLGGVGPRAGTTLGTRQQLLGAGPVHHLRKVHSDVS